jgi:hypothetical protein
MCNQHGSNFRGIFITLQAMVCRHVFNIVPALILLDRDSPVMIVHPHFHVHPIKTPPARPGPRRAIRLSHDCRELTRPRTASPRWSTAVTCCRPQQRPRNFEPNRRPNIIMLLRQPPPSDSSPGPAQAPRLALRH